MTEEEQKMIAAANSMLNINRLSHDERDALKMYDQLVTIYSHIGMYSDESIRILKILIDTGRLLPQEKRIMTQFVTQTDEADR